MAGSRADEKGRGAHVRMPGSVLSDRRPRRCIRKCRPPLATVLRRIRSRTGPRQRHPACHLPRQRTLTSAPKHRANDWGLGREGGRAAGSMGSTMLFISGCGCGSGSLTHPARTPPVDLARTACQPARSLAARTAQTRAPPTPGTQPSSQPCASPSPSQSSQPMKWAVTPA